MFRNTLIHQSFSVHPAARVAAACPTIISYLYGKSDAPSQRNIVHPIKSSVTSFILWPFHCYVFRHYFHVLRGSRSTRFTACSILMQSIRTLELLFNTNSNLKLLVCGLVERRAGEGVHKRAMGGAGGRGLVLISLKAIYKVIQLAQQTIFLLNNTSDDAVHAIKFVQNNLIVSQCSSCSVRIARCIKHFL